MTQRTVRESDVKVEMQKENAWNRIRKMEFEAEVDIGGEEAIQGEKRKEEVKKEVKVVDVEL